MSCHQSVPHARTSVFRGLSLTLEEGKTYGLTGPNGSGKSVLLKLICGFEFPDEGEVIVNP
ncbi:ATP-binding cassette domain-containing protein, partial [Leifsonia sp. TF02-11]|nr:ATP-binding cassette domain-containing protein [Leifsonia sp. TF02-11]